MLAFVRRLRAQPKGCWSQIIKGWSSSILEQMLHESPDRTIYI